MRPEALPFTPHWQVPWGAVATGPGAPEPVPVPGATAAIWHLKPPAFFFLFDRNWSLSHLAFLVAGIVSPYPSSNVPKILFFTLLMLKKSPLRRSKVSHQM